MFVWHFPGNYTWSFNTMGILTTARWGGSEPGEVYEVIEALKNDVGNPERWFEEWTRKADQVAAKGDRAYEAGYFRTAADCYLRANRYYQAGERMLKPDDPRKAEAYAKSIRCFHKAIELMEEKIERVEVPYEGTSFSAYYLHPSGKPGIKKRLEAWSEAGPRRNPAVVVFDGLDATAEFMYFFVGRALAERGFSVLLCDAPGWGGALRLKGMTNRYDYEAVGTAALEYLLTRPEVDPDRIGILGMSLGGYYAPRAAAFEPRYKACVAYGANYDVYTRWKRRFERGEDKTISAGPPHQVFWVYGATTQEELLEKMKRFDLGQALPHLKCPLLVLHGEDDAQVPKEEAIATYEAAGSEDKQLIILTAEEGGNQHCQLDNLSAAHYYMLDWLEEKLG